MTPESSNHVPKGIANYGDVVKRGIGRQQFRSRGCYEVAIKAEDHQPITQDLSLSDRREAMMNGIDIIIVTIGRETLDDLTVPVVDEEHDVLAWPRYDLRQRWPRQDQKRQCCKS